MKRMRAKLNKKGLLIVFSGPAGSGKSTVLAEFMRGRGDCMFSVSSTTRSRRPGEVDGVNYNFTTRENFRQLIENDELLEHTEYCGNYYGTPIKPVLEAINKGLDVIFDIEVDGAFQVKRKYPESVTIFMKPPTVEALYERLKKRNTESDEVIERRMERALFELELAKNYDYVIINDKVDRTVKDLEDVIKDAHARAKE